MKLNALLALLLLLPAAPAGAWQADENHDLYEVNRRAAVRPRSSPVRQALLARAAAWTRFQATHPGWVARFDERQGTVERAEGPAWRIPGVSAIAPGRVETAARSALAAMSELAAVDGRLDFVREAAFKDRFWAHFRQELNGVPVFNARVSLLLTNDGRVLQVENRAVRNLDLSTTPGLPAGTAEAAGRQGLPAGATLEASPELAILPLDRAAGRDPRLAWQMTFRTVDPPGQWITFVDAASGELLWRFNNVRHAAVNGQVTGDIEPGQNDGLYQSLGLPYLGVSIRSGGVSIGAGNTDANGHFNVTVPGATGRSLVAPLAGLYGFVLDASNNNQIATLTLPVPDGDLMTVDAHFDDGNSLASARDAYFHAMATHDYIKTVQPDFTVLDYGMPIHVEVDGTCNAFWDGVGLNFFKDGGGCSNSARLATIVMHEYGHGITDFLYRPFFPSGAMHEGWSDYTACTMTDQPIVGPNWRPGQPNSIVRRIDVDRIQPRDLTGEVHNDGLVIASCLWDIRTALGAGLTDSLWHFARYGYSDNYDDYFVDVLRTDDDNADIYDGTPHFGVLVGEFRRHGIGDYAIRVSHAGTPDTEDTLKAVPLRASFLSIFALQEGSVQAHLDIEGPGGSSSTSLGMTPTGGIREYELVLDPQPAGTTVRYWFTAADTSGQTVTWPPDGAADPFLFRVGPDLESPLISHEPLPDQPIDIPSLMFRTGVVDNLDRGLGEVRLYYGLNGDRSDPGHLVLPESEGFYRPTIYPLSGLALGDLLEYRLSADDSATVPNRAWEPANGWHSFHMVRGFGRDFETDDGGFSGDADWVWGPAPGANAWSGSHVWDTSPAGNYTDQTVSILELPPVDLTSFGSAALTFRHRYYTEFAYDGGLVEASADTGRTWTPLIPDGDYPFPRVVALAAPGFTGRSDDWTAVECDLSTLVGRPLVRLRFRFASDQAITAPGWTIDDVQVVERQIPSRPLGLEAASGKDGRVPLRWGAPAGIDESAPNPVLGYHLYRRAAGETTLVRITESPLASRHGEDTSVTNGVSYDYFVSALYTGGESPLTGPATAWPYRPALGLAGSPVEATIDSVDTSIVPLTLSNSGTGLLRVNAYPALSSQTLENVRIRVGLTGGLSGPVGVGPSTGPAGLTPESGLEELRAPGKGAVDVSGLLRPKAVPPTGDWETLFVNTQEGPTVAPDLASVAIQQTDDQLWFRLTSWAPWDQVLADFNLLFSFNTDDNIGTNGNGEYLLLAGPIVAGNFGLPALLVLPDFSPVAIPHHLILADSSQVAEFGIDKADIGAPETMTLVVRALSPNASTTIDRIPDAVTIPWLTAAPRYVEAPVGAPATLNLTLDSAPVENGTHTARLLLDTNDPGQPESIVPVTLNVSGRTPVVLADFQATPGPDGLLLEWRTTEEVDHLGFHVHRRDTGPVPGSEQRLTAELLPPAPGGRYRFLDRSAEPGHTYEYRLADLGRTGQLAWHGPFRVTMTGSARPSALWLGPAMPNPARGSTEIAWALPAAGPVTIALFDLEGRLVRRLVDLPWQEPGYFHAPWDGRDDDGRPVGGGVYFYRLTAAGRSLSGKVLRLR